MTFPLQICIGVSIASVLCLDLSPVPFRERNNFIQLIKTYNCTVLTDFPHSKLSTFQTPSLRFILKIFLKFHKCQPRCSYETYSYRSVSGKCSGILDYTMQLLRIQIQVFLSFSHLSQFLKHFETSLHLCHASMVLF